MRIVAFFLILFLLIGCDANKKRGFHADSPASTLYLDLFLKKLTGSACQGETLKSEEIVLEIEKIIKTTSNPDTLATEIGHRSFVCRYTEEGEYVKLAHAFISARDNLKTINGIKALELRNLQATLNRLVKEIVYAQAYFFGTKSGDTSIVYQKDQSNKLDCVFVLTAEGVNTCVSSGDILISKNTLPTSSFIGSTTMLFDDYSHVGVVYVVQGKPYIISADVHDGLKIRETKAELLAYPKAILEIYRLKDKKLARSVDAATEEVAFRIKSQQCGENKEKCSRGGGYDFEMDLSTDESVYCAEVPIIIYKKVKAKQKVGIDPFPLPVWNYPLDGKRKKFLGDFFDIKNPFPSPGDVQINPDFELIHVHYNKTVINMDRTYTALAKVISETIFENYLLISAGPKFFEFYFGRNVDQQKLLALVKEMRDRGVFAPHDLEDKISKLPPSISYKLVFLYAFLNEALAPKAIASLASKKSELLAMGDLESGVRQIVKSELISYVINFVGTTIKGWL